MPRKHIPISANAEGEPIYITVNTDNLFGAYAEIVRWFARWELHRLERLVQGEAAPNPFDEQICRRVEAINNLEAELRPFLMQAGEDGRIGEIRRELRALSTPEIQPYEDYWEQLHKLVLLDEGIIVLGIRLGSPAVQMQEFVQTCKAGIIQLSRWDRAAEAERGADLERRWEQLCALVLQPLANYSLTAECAGIRDCDFARNAESQAEQAQDLSAYCNASQFVDGRRFHNVNAVKRFLGDHPDVRTHKPARNRLLVHAGDMKRALKAERDEALAADKALTKQANSYLVEKARRQEPRQVRAKSK